MHADLKHIFFVYLLALLGAVASVFFLADYLPKNPLALALAADIIATFIIFVASLIYRNASLYDPYWSVAPFFIALYWLAEDIHLRGLFVLGFLFIWGTRLTTNWALRWRGLSDVDWRYLDIQAKTKRAYPLANFFAIQLLPTLIVFVGLLPVFAVINSDAPLNLLDALALIITGGAILLQATADNQLRTFLKIKKGNQDKDGEILKSGLWKYMRHPNYLGEVGFWWGLCFFGLAASGNSYLLASPFVMTALFVFVSVPLMNRRGLARRANYQEHIKSTYALVPIPKKVKK